MKRRLAAVGLVFIGLVPLACGSEVTIAPTPPGGGGGGASSSSSSSGQGGVGASGGGPTEVDAGPVGSGGCNGTTPLPLPQPVGQACECASSKGFVLDIDSACGGLILPAVYYDPNNAWQPPCHTDMAIATSYACKTYFQKTASACVGPNLAPCISLLHKKFTDGEERSGTFIDGTGQTWTLSDVVFGDTNVLSTSGNFKALATGPDGQTMTLSGSFDLCLPFTIKCPV